MSQWHASILALATVFGSLGLVYLLTRFLISAMWSTLSSRYPARPILPSAVSKGWQSIALHGWMGFNNCLTISVDEQHLHLIPWRIVRALGAPPVSIPWDVITDVRPSWPKAYSKARVGGTAIQAPAWCLELATPPAEVADGGPPTPR